MALRARSPPTEPNTTRSLCAHGHHMAMERAEEDFVPVQIPTWGGRCGETLTVSRSFRPTNPSGHTCHWRACWMQETQARGPCPCPRRSSQWRRQTRAKKRVQWRGEGFVSRKLKALPDAQGAGMPCSHHPGTEQALYAPPSLQDHTHSCKQWAE